MISGTKKIIPEVGMGATLCSYTDRDAGTISSVFEEKGKKFIGVQEDFAKRIDKNGFSEDQTYEYSPNPDAYTHYYRFNEKTQSWEGVLKSAETNRWKKYDRPGLIIGRKEKYHDFSF
jgi:hypothetical protein